MNEATGTGPMRPPISWGAAFVQLAGFAGASHLVYLVATLHPGFESSGLASGTGVSEFFASHGLGPSLALYAVLPAVVEELLFRGALFAMLQRIGGAGLAILGSALLFGVAHLDPLHAAVGFALGLQLGALRLTFGLPLAIAAHFTGNALAIATSPLVAPGGALDLAPEAAWITLPLAMAAAGSAWATLVQRMRSTRAGAAACRTGLQTPPQSDE